MDDRPRHLTAEFGAVLAVETVSKLVQESFDLISAKATVGDFIGMFARRTCRTRLLALVAQEGVSPTGPEPASPVPAPGPAAS